MNQTVSNWVKVTRLDAIPALGARVLEMNGMKIAIFRNNSNQVFALKDECPHKKGPLSQGIVHGNTVTCPLHNWKISLESGEAVAPDEGCTNHFATKIEDGDIYISVS
jgi:nitrite reductase (NADH) small subunit